MNHIYSLIVAFWIVGLIIVGVGMAGMVSVSTTGYFVSPATAGYMPEDAFNGFTIFGVSMLLAAAFLALWRSSMTRQQKKYIAG
ncbi:MAG: hypothetical protein HY367_00630 [Candidatus Aenigmarchaeota archaeon]|nr:hypothetical protein [Candidatus Aenigmarchaeota archaeon]